MALALLDLLGVDADRARLRIDTGTNRYYRLELGLANVTRSGFDWIDEVVHRTPITPNPAGGGLLNTSTELTVPTRGIVPTRHGLPVSHLFAQLFSFKTADGRGLGFSKVVPVVGEMAAPGPGYVDYGSSLSITNGAPALAPPRAVACRTCAEAMTAPRLDDLLAQLVRLAAPAVLQLLGQAGGGTAAGGAASSVGAPSGGAATGPAAALGPLLQALVGAVPGLVSQLSVSQTSSSPSTLLAPHAEAGENRFTSGQKLSRPMVFGIDDALLIPLIGQIAGPLLNVLPQLLNSANQQRLQMRESQNHFVSDLVGQVERRMLLQQVMQAQQSAPAGQTADLQRLAELLQQAGAGAPAAGAGTGTPAAIAPAASGAAGAATAASLSASDAALSNRAVVSFVTAPPIAFGGAERVLFAKGRAVTVNVKLTVAEPAPAKPLPKAIVRVVIKDPADQRVLADKVVKQRDLAANTTVAVAFTVGELAAIPSGRPVSLLAEIRWRTAAGSERKALGAQDAVFTDRLFLKARGGDAGPERELTDMARYRPFWNKVWEAPTVSADQTLWGLDVTMKYSVLLTAHPANGTMQTRVGAAPDASADALRAQTAGKMKAGIECSVGELAKLASLWDGEPVLDAEHRAAFSADAFTTQNAGEVVTRVELDGPREQRGLVWVVPVLKLIDYTLGAVKTVDASGQVTGIEEEHAHLPLPCAIRILGLRSGDAGDAGVGEEPAYRFDGYRIEHSDKVALTPHG
ncbi:MAG: hypothetical protein ACYDHH_00180 [Solirubrobacteraceae bacterium]